MTTFLNTLDPFLFRPTPVTPPASSHVAQHQDFQVCPVLLVKLRMSADIIEWLQESWKWKSLDHCRRKNSLCQSRQVSPQRIRLISPQLGTSIIVVELYWPDPRLQRAGCIFHANTPPMTATRRACISAIPRASLFARSRPLR